MKKIFKDKVRRVQKEIRRILPRLVPRKIAHRLVRNQLRIPMEPPEGVVFRLANGVEELEQAFRLLHDNFVRESYMDPHPLKRRVTPYHALPTSAVIVADKGGRIVATATIVQSSPFGLPLEKVFELRKTIEAHAPVVEVSSLAVHPEHSGKRGEMLFAFMKYIHHFNRDIVRAPAEVAGVNPKMIPLYESILLFERLHAGPPRQYAFVNSAPVIPLICVFKEAEERGEVVYKGRPPHKNIFAYFRAEPFKTFRLPEDPNWVERLPQRDLENFRRLFISRENLIATMTPTEVSALISMYEFEPQIQKEIHHAASQPR